ncbi:MAG: site-specific DNA-methyltransferase [bacterium]|nr:site-specific DNA-methyltransferase [bacterium]
MSEEILKLKKEIERLKKSVKKQRYGLVWMDVPEAFEDDVENKLPILKEVPELAIKNNDGKPTHILIEGDNYHALTCLNYTHKGKIDVIYIDPPYNTGSDGFRYKDKRILDKFPDGTEVPKDHPFRHSYWLSFMRKRLELAKDLLSEEGIIFVSIDDNELAQLKLLMDDIFSNTSGKGFMGTLIWQRAKGGGNSKKVVRGHDYVLCYSNSDDLTLTQKGDKAIEHIRKFQSGKVKDRYLMKEGKLYFINDDVIRRVFGKYKKGTERRCEYENLLKYKGKKIKDEVDKKLADGEYILKKAKNGMHYICRSEEVGSMRQVMYTIIQGYLSEVGKNDLGKFDLEDKFEYPKPVGLIKTLLDTVLNKKIIILDFFAGSGTTGQALLELNTEDEGERQFILITNNENNILKGVCYPRIKRVISGYTNKQKEKYNALGNSLKYYKAAFIGKNNILNATDQDKIELAHNAGELLAIAENTLELTKQNKFYQLFKDGNKEKYTAVYFREELDKFDEFAEMIKKLKKQTAVYIFSWGDEAEIEEFDDIEQIKIKTIPLPILEIYKQIYNISTN